MTLGRNEPCHCGSGKKYKRCHLDADGARARLDAALANGMLHDLPTMRMAVAETMPGFSALVMAVAVKLNETFREEIGDGLEGEDAANALIGYMERIEAAMADIASTHSRGYWMHMTRRLPPTPFGSASDWTVRLYKRVLTLAAIKHGRPTSNGEEFETHKSPFGDYQVPATLDHAAIVDAFALRVPRLRVDERRPGVPARGQRGKARRGRRRLPCCRRRRPRRIDPGSRPPGPGVRLANRDLRRLC